MAKSGFAKEHLRSFIDRIERLEEERSALTADIRDLYGQLIDGMQGARGQIRTGGDAGGGELQGSPPTQKPLALYSGIVAVKPDGTAEVLFDIPDFAGTARVMAVACSDAETRFLNCGITRLGSTDLR